MIYICKYLLIVEIESIFKINFRCRGLILLETYSADETHVCIPTFLNVEKEVTGNPAYSMFNLSLREDWKNSKRFCKYGASGKYAYSAHIYKMSIWKI